MKLNHETKVGLLAAISVTLLILGYNFLEGDKLFQKSFYLVSKYEKVNGLNIGNPVIFNGLTVGQISSLEMDPKEGYIIVQYSVERGLQIPVDSRAKIFSSDLLGSKALEIERGASKESCKNGQFIDGYVEKTLGEQVQEEILPLKDQLSGMMGQIERLLSTVNRTFDETAENRIDKILEDFTVVGQNMKSISYKTDSTIGTFQRTSYKIDQVVNNLNKQNDNINKIMTNAGSFTDSLNLITGDIRSMIGKMNNAIADVEGVMEEFKDGDGSIPRMLRDSSFYVNTTQTIARLDTFVTEFTEDPRLDIYLRMGTKRNRKPEEKSRAARNAAKGRKKKKDKEGGVRVRVGEDQ